jgi:Domain of unknown function (DUF4180)
LSCPNRIVSHTAGAVRGFQEVSVRVHEYTGAVVRTERDATDAVGDALSAGGVDVVAIPADLFAPEFFDLRTGLAGAVLQKFVNYHLRLAVVGDIAHHLRASAALRALVAESNRGGQVWFVADRAELDAKLTA